VPCTTERGRYNSKRELNSAEVLCWAAGPLVYNVGDAAGAVRAHKEWPALAKRRGAPTCGVDASAVSAVGINPAVPSTVWRAALQAVEDVGDGDCAVCAEIPGRTYTHTGNTHTAFAPAIIVAAAGAAANRVAAEVHLSSRAVQHVLHTCVLELARIGAVADNMGLATTVAATPHVLVAHTCTILAGANEADALLAQGWAVGSRPSTLCVNLALVPTTAGHRWVVGRRQQSHKSG
jgi:hypothetical protein